jgi:hypothetical protein
VTLADVGNEVVTVMPAVFDTPSTVAVTCACPFATAVTVTDAPLGAIVATLVGVTVQLTVRPESVFPLASFGVAVIDVVSVGLSTACVWLSDTELTAAGGGGFVDPPPLLLPPHAPTNAQTQIVMTNRATPICSSLPCVSPDRRE